MSKTIQPNQLAQATQELSNLNLEGYTIPQFISKGEVNEYVYICVKSKDNFDGTSKMHSAKTLYAPIDKHVSMVKEIKRYKGIWNGMYNKVVILHNPTKPAAVKKNKGGRPKVKKEETK